MAVGILDLDWGRVNSVLSPTSSLLRRTSQKPRHHMAGYRCQLVASCGLIVIGLLVFSSSSETLTVSLGSLGLLILNWRLYL